MKLIPPSNNSNAYSLSIDPKEIGKGDEGTGMGLEISIKGLNGNPAEGINPTSIFIEYFEGKTQLHVWTNNNRDPQTIILT